MSTTRADEQRLQDLARSSVPPLAIGTDETGVHLKLDNGLGFYHSFVTGPMKKRAVQPGQLLLKACNSRARDIHSILDLTAGWGVDAFTLANQGRQVCMIEQNPLVHAVLDWSLQALRAGSDWRDQRGDLQLRQASAIDYLQASDTRYDCIYLDPMFPAHKSGAKPGKEMQILQALTVNDRIEACFELALQRANKRVVVKRSAKAAALTALKPDLTHQSKTIRFDVYLRHS